MLVRWLLRKDMPDVLRIEELNFEFPWDEKEFIEVLRQRNAIAMVAEHQDRVLGFVFYEIESRLLYLHNMAVHPNSHRQGVGTAIINKLRSKLTEKRTLIEMHVGDHNLSMHLFLKNRGFSACGVCKNYYNNGQDAYHFVFRENAYDEARFYPAV